MPQTTQQPAQQQPVQQPEQLDGGWAAGFTADMQQEAPVRQQQQRQQAAVLPPLEEVEPAAVMASNCSGGNEFMMEPSPTADEDARQGLVKASRESWWLWGQTACTSSAVLLCRAAAQRLAAAAPLTAPPLPLTAQVAESMRRRVDDGHLQLLRQRRLLAQKQELVGRGEAVLAQHCRASWQQQKRQAWAGEQQLEEGAVAVHRLEASCAAGQWWLAAAVSLPPEWQQQLDGGSATAALLAASPGCSLVCRQQQCTCSGGGGGGGSGREPAAVQGQVHLTALLDVQQQQQQQQQQQEGTWADVFLLVEVAAADAEADRGAAAAGAAGVAAAAAVLDAPAAAPPVLLGRVQLSWQEWLRSHTPQGTAQQPPAPPPRPQLSRAVAVLTQQLDLACLHQIVQQQLGCSPATADMDAERDSSSSGGMPRQSYMLLGAVQQDGGSLAAAAGAAAAAAVHVTQHSPHFAEVQLQSHSTHMLCVLQQQLQQGLRRAEQAAGVPGGDATLAPSLLSPQHSAVAAIAGDALVAELNASIEWVEALLKEKLALGSRERRRRAAPDPAAARGTQAAALAAAVATDGCLLRMLDGC